jgi:CRISPR type III-B/RAMP module RAMP protein Cmr6
MPDEALRPSPRLMAGLRRTVVPQPGAAPVPREPDAPAGPATGPTVAGPMGHVVKWGRVSPGGNRPERDELAAVASGRQLDGNTNALIMLNRLAVYEVDAKTGQVALPVGGKKALLLWACQQQLGQDANMVKDVAQRRQLALDALDREGGQRPRCHLRLTATPEWRLAVGLGNQANAHEIGLLLHGTYGWPIIPGSSLKGLARAWAESPEAEIEEEVLHRVFGTGSHEGTVRFLDAIPAEGPVKVEANVLTPHVKPYYSPSGEIAPPAEYHNPEPINFLTVCGPYAIDLYGPSRDDLDLAAYWLKQAGDQLGAGAKTAAGYGYLKVGKRK